MTTETVNKKKNRRSKKSKVISFDEEIVTKDAAKEILANSIQLEEIPQEHSRKSKKKRKGEKSNEAMEVVDSEDVNEEMETEMPLSPKKKKKRNQMVPQEETPGSKTPSNSKTTVSIRAQKRQKYEKLLGDKRMKTELSLQQKALNYLSMWKHSKNDWKFEKLRQVWLQQNMFDSAKIPSDFWSTLVEYFANCKGQARNVILKEALKLVEKDEGAIDNEDMQIKISRAREMVQNLQE